MGRKHGVAWTIVFMTCLSGLRVSAQEKTGLSLKFGMSERLRNEYYNNITDMNKDVSDRTDYYRIRTSVWGQARYAPYATFYAKLTNEFRKYTLDPKERDFTWEEIVFDNLYLKLETPNKMAALTVGRQNLMYGEGFILMDGAPWDGSRTIYHDAIKLSLAKGKTSIDLLAIDNTRTEDRLPVIRDPGFEDGTLTELKKGVRVPQSLDQMMNDGEEKALGLYATTTAVAKAKIEAYFLRKTEMPDPWINMGGSKDELNLNTLGARVNYGFTDRISLTTEWALQSGSQGSIDHSAVGGYGYVTYLIDQATKSSLSGGIICLTGDDPATADKNEGWNPMFARLPKWSELYIYSYLNEVNRGSVRVSYWTNLWSPYISYTVALSKKATLIGNFYLLKAFQKRSIPGGGIGNGLSRGNEIQVWFKYAFNKYLSGHVLLDQLVPGDFYPMPHTSGPFLRGELLFSI
jgi:hypothetical protein